MPSNYQSMMRSFGYLWSVQATDLIKRQISLDGLRGLAALVVVLNHTSLTESWFAERVGLIAQPLRGRFNGGYHGILEYTPIHIFFAGTEAVIIFFVLSGYVLINAIKKNYRLGYLRSRLVRLYAPIFGSVIVALVLSIFINRDPTAYESWWMKSHAVKFGLRDFITNVLVIDGTTWLNSSLWSMRYEIMFSLLVFIFYNYKLRISTLRFIISFFLCLFILVVAMHFNFDFLTWLPVFFSGTVLWFLESPTKKASYLFLILGWLTILVPWYLAGFGFSLGNEFNRCVATIGAISIVHACRCDSGLIPRFLGSKFPQVLGKYSYSLYLVHAPVLVSVFFAMGNYNFGSLTFAVCVAIAWSLIILMTWVMYRFIERPVLMFIHKTN